MGLTANIFVQSKNQTMPTPIIHEFVIKYLFSISSLESNEGSRVVES